MALNDIKHETTLSTIALEPESHNHSNLFAVVIDVSEPSKSETNNNFITKLKIIDPSFNYKAEVKVHALKFHKFVHVNIYTETPEQAPKIVNVGDIIRIRRFRFKHTEKGELMANELHFSNWLIYPAIAGKHDVSTSYKSWDKNLNRELTASEQNRISDLRKWSHNFLANNSLIYVSWWSGLKEVEENVKEKVHDRIDLILKVKSIQAKTNKVLFVDKDNRQFELRLSSKPSIKENDVIKLRCVEITVKRDKEVTRSIKTTNHSSCLNMLPFTSDYKQFDKAVQEQKRSPAKNTKTIDPFINDYQVDDTGAGKSSKSTPKKGPKAKDEKVISAIKKTYNTKKVSTVEDLQGYLKNPEAHHGQKFVIRGFIQDFSSTDPAHIIKFLHIDDRKFLSLGDKLTHLRKQRATYQFVMQVKDESNESDAPLDVYVATGEYNSHLFTTWKLLPEWDDVAGFEALHTGKKLQEFSKKLESVRGQDNVARLVVELNISKKGNAFYKLVDTIFLA